MNSILNINKRKSYQDLTNIDTLQVIKNTQISLSTPNSPGLPNEEHKDKFNHFGIAEKHLSNEDHAENQLNEQNEEYKFQTLEDEEELKITDELE